MGLFTKKPKTATENLCVKIRKSVMDETLDSLRKIREEMEAKKLQTN